MDVHGEFMREETEEAAPMKREMTASGFAPKAAETASVIATTCPNTRTAACYFTVSNKDIRRAINATSG
jgi:hypothetical protein